MKTRLIAIFAILILFLSACATRAPQPVIAPQPAVDEGGRSAAPAAEGYTAKQDASTKTTQSQNANAPDRLIIKTAVMTVVADDPAKVMESITKMANEMGGFVVTSNLYKTQKNDIEVPEAKVTVRVPSEKLDSALATIKTFLKDPTADVLSENVTGENVTQQYIDLQSRLANLEQAEKQLQKIMDTTTKADETLNVFNRLTQIREQIEVLKGQINYYERAAALSSLSVQIQSNTAVRPVKIGSWQPVGVALAAIQALINTAKFLVNALIWIILFVIPVGFLIYLPIRLTWVVGKRLLRRRKVAKTSEPPASPQV
ncbi:MAG TPA: DUF4349 domain-containing protein [Anaerolineaceae bacterium]